MDAITSAQYLAMMAKKNKGQNNKYKNHIVEVDGIKFHSAKEAAYYGELKIRKMTGDILSFERQIRYKLEVNGVLICTYISDFEVVLSTGIREVIDVKSFFTRRLPEYRKKKKLMKAIYNIEIKEV